MPIYVYRCKLCGYEHEEVKPYSNSYESKCKFCGSIAHRAHDKEIPVIRPDVEPGFNISLGKHVTSRKDIRKEAAYLNAAVPDLMLNSYPSDGRLTAEERAEAEGRETVVSRVGRDDPARHIDKEIAIEGEADYSEIKKYVRKRHGWRDE